jgi:hypothetical protein
MLAILLVVSLTQGALPFSCDGKSGWAFSPYPKVLLTVAHLSSTGTCTYEIDRERHSAKRQWVDTKRDLALFNTETEEEIPFSHRVKISRDKPEETEELYYKGMVDKGVTTTIVGRYLGENLEGFLVIDGWVYPGSSGSPIWNKKKEVVGIILGAVQWAFPPMAERLRAGDSLNDNLLLLERKAILKSAVYGWPLKTGLPSPPKKEKKEKK